MAHCLMSNVARPFDSLAEACLEWIRRQGYRCDTHLTSTRVRARNMTAYVSQNAFWGLLISAVEVYKRECFGLLIGYRVRRGRQEMYIVEHALPYQTAGRRHKGVVSNPRAHKPLERFLSNTPQLSLFGDFPF